MSSSPYPEPDPAAWKTRLRSLALLLEDDSPRVLSRVQDEFRRLGKRGRHTLRKATRSGSPARRARARQLLVEQDREKVVRRLIRYATRGTHDLERGLLLLDGLRGSGEDASPTIRTLDALAQGVRKRMEDRPPGLARAMALVDSLAGDRGITGAPDDFHHPDNIFLGRTLARRRGMPLTLCAVYSLVARRVGLTANLLPFPGHVLLRIADGEERAIIDPFDEGRVLNEVHCLTYLADHGFPYRSEWFRPATDTAMLRRHVLNLINSLRGRSLHADARSLEVVHGLLMGKGGHVKRIVRTLTGWAGHDGSDS